MKTRITLCFFGLIILFTSCEKNNDQTPQITHSKRGISASALADKRLNEVMYLTNHNAYNNNGIFDRQQYSANSISVQLQKGVRGFMLDTYNSGSLAVCFHGTVFNGGVYKLKTILEEIRGFLNSNPNEIVFLFVENYANLSNLENTLNETNIKSRLVSNLSKTNLPTIAQQTSTGKNLIIFVDDVGRKLPANFSVTNPYLHQMFDYCVDTEWNNRGSFGNYLIRGNINNKFFILNHMMYPSSGITSNDGLAKTWNPRLESRINDYYNGVYSFFPRGKIINFPTVDYFDAVKVTDPANGQQIPNTIAVVRKFNNR